MTAYGQDEGKPVSEREINRDTERRNWPRYREATDMADRQAHAAAAPVTSRQAPIVVPTNKVTVALPFSKITLEEPARELAELAAIVAELAVLIETVTAGPDAAQLRMRAQALAARIR